VLEMGAGERAEHAILLCNYLLYLKKEAWVVLGRGIPEGPTAYVMTRADSLIRASTRQTTNQTNPVTAMNTVVGPTFTFVNPVTGDTFPDYDILCPLRDIHCIFDNTNIWANLQTSGEPYHMNFNFANLSNWEPFFTPKFPWRQLPNVQTEQLTYENLQDTQLQDLQAQIETSLLSAAEKFRAPRFPTKWNRVCNRTLRDLLGKCEGDIIGRGSLDEADHLKTLSEILTSYDVHGFPLNVAFNGVQQLLASVFATNIFHSEDANTEFSLAVRVCPFPGKICSVWIYLAALVPKLKGRY